MLEIVESVLYMLEPGGSEKRAPCPGDAVSDMLFDVSGCTIREWKP